ncbi:unnamed protein product [Durusdinium trenchii]|uniref:Uncharacterized protein n=1 Tax=Durusdinium trenchii TaxID=1381693 RepID=A0ABP0QSZ4_9DINO
MATYPAYIHMISSTALVAMSGNEICGLVATYMGTKRTQELIPHLRSRCLPSFLLALMFGWLAVVEYFFARPGMTLAHVHTNADGMTVMGRPVYTLRYIEWCINVPILFLLSGHCSLGRPVKEISRPLMVTNVYIIFSWMATVTESALLKWTLIMAAFFMYGWASLDMMGWSREFERTAPQDLPSRSVRPWLSNGLIIHFQFFAACYMASCLGIIDAKTEQVGYFIVTFGAKIAYCATFVFIRADEYHKTLTDVLQKVSVSNVGMISILRCSFDIIVPCVMDAAGRCKLPLQVSGDMLKLEKMLGCPVAGANLKDLLAQEKDRTDFSEYVRNVVRQADCPQAFSEATLTTSGVWSCGAGVTPPMAQVLHSKVRAGSAQFRATIHLSVVPRSAMSNCKERNLVAAIQFEELEDQADPDLDTAEASGYETFKDQRQTSAGQSTNVSSDGGIVANLQDLQKLGATLRADDFEEDDASAYWGQTRSDETMSHLGAFVSDHSFDARICGLWEGKTSETLGGYTQQIEFEMDCRSAKVTVLGQTLNARFSMNCSVEPKQLNIQVIPTSGTVPPMIPYIFKFADDGSLYLSGPADSSMRRATSFGGSGLCIMQRVDQTENHENVEKTSVRSGLPPSKLQPLFEPDPEFRTEAPAVAVAARKVPVEQVPVPVGPKSHWMQEPLHESRETNCRLDDLPGACCCGILGTGPDQHADCFEEVHVKCKSSRSTTVDLNADWD